MWPGEPATNAPGTVRTPFERSAERPTTGIATQSASSTSKVNSKSRIGDGCGLAGPGTDLCGSRTQDCRAPVLSSELIRTVAAAGLPASVGSAAIAPRRGPCSTARAPVAENRPEVCGGAYWRPIAGRPVIRRRRPARPGDRNERRFRWSRAGPCRSSLRPGTRWRTRFGSSGGGALPRVSGRRWRAFP